MAAVGVYSTSVLSYRFMKGEISKKEYLQQTARAFAAASATGLGLWAGSSAGATIGMMIAGPAGSLFGAIIGGLSSGLLGNKASKMAFDEYFPNTEHQLRELMIQESLLLFGFLEDDIKNANIFNIAEVKRRYIQLALRYHPDVNGTNTTDQWHQVNVSLGVVLGARLLNAPRNVLENMVKDIERYIQQKTFEEVIEEKSEEKTEDVDNKEDQEDIEQEMMNESVDNKEDQEDTEQKTMNESVERKIYRAKIAVLNQIGDAIDADSAVMNKNNYNEMDESIDFDDGWELSMDQQLLERQKRHQTSRCCEERKEIDVINEEELKYDTQQKRIISNALVINICIENYDGDKASDFKYSYLDKQHMIDLFVGKYNYDMLCNKTKRCRRSELDKIIRKGQEQFGDERNKYQCIIVIYSGHGTNESLICSDIDNGMRYGYKEKNRLNFTKSFNGNHVVNKITALKIYFIDACRGDMDAIPIRLHQNDQIGAQRANPYDGNSGTYHPDAQTAIFAPNTGGFQSYSEPKKGGILINALYETMMDENKNNDKTLDNIEQILRFKIDNKKIDVLNIDKKTGKEFITQHPVLLDPNFSGLSPQDRQSIYFTRNDVPKSQRQFIQYCIRNKDDLLHQNIDFK